MATATATTSGIASIATAAAVRVSRPGSALSARCTGSSSSSSSSSVFCLSNHRSALASQLISPLASTSLSASAVELGFRNSAILGRLIHTAIGSPRGNFSTTKHATMASASLGSAATKGSGIHTFTVKDIDGNDVSLGDYKGKVALIVNVASQCGLTNQNYKELVALYNKYKNQGFVVLAFPTNQFGGQEPKSNAEIKKFAEKNYGTTFPMFSKVDVNGESAAPLFKWLKAQKGGMLTDDIKWNFGKFLVDKDGNVVQRYAPTTSPLQIEDDLKKLL